MSIPAHQELVHLCAQVWLTAGQNDWATSSFLSLPPGRDMAPTASSETVQAYRCRAGPLTYAVFKWVKKFEAASGLTQGHGPWWGCHLFTGAFPLIRLSAGTPVQTWLCSGSLLVVLGRPHEVLEIEPGSAVCRANTLTLYSRPVPSWLSLHSEFTDFSAGPLLILTACPPQTVSAAPQLCTAKRKHWGRGPQVYRFYTHRARPPPLPISC